MEQSVQNGNVVRQHIVRTEEQILNLLEECEKSGFTAKEFCEVSEIHEATFYPWLRKYPKGGVEDVKGFTEIEVIPTLVHSKPKLFAEVVNIKLYKKISGGALPGIASRWNNSLVPGRLYIDTTASCFFHLSRMSIR